MQLTVLGTAAPFPVPGNACSGYLLRSGGAVGGAAAPGARPTALWIDAGTGTFAELQRHIAPGDLDAVFVSHRHADHTADLLVASYAYRFGAAPALAARGSRRIPVFGPEGLAERLADYLGPAALTGLESVFAFTELHGWGDARVSELELAWGPVSHGVPAFGLTVVERAAPAPAVSAPATPGPALPAPATPGPATPGPATPGPATPGPATPGPSTRRGFTYSGDTAPCISIVELAEESSTLLCEAGYDQAPSGEYVHCTPEDAGRQATEAGVATLVLTHIADGLAPAAAAARARTTFAGTVRVATSGDTFAV